MEVSGRRKEGGDCGPTSCILCDPCLGVNEEKIAVFYCTMCNEFLCDVDAKKHRKAAMSKAHQLLDGNNMPKQKLGSYEDNICPKHKGDILKYYCNSHNESCCAVCTTQEHKQCDVEYIDDIAKVYEKISEFRSLMEDITNLTRRLHRAEQQSVEYKSNAQHLHSEIISEIRQFRVEINSILDSLENASLKEAKGILHVISDAAELQTENCDTLISKLQEMTSSIENLRKYKQERQLVLHSKNVRAQVKDIEDKFSKLSCLKKSRYYKFIPDKGIPKLLRSLKSLGRLEITAESKKPKENEQKARQDYGAEVSVSVLNPPVTMTHVRAINIKHSTDTEAWSMAGGVIIEENKLVWVDRNNKSVKDIDVISNKVTSCIKVRTQPWDITRVEQDQVVVSCDGGKLVFLKVGKTLSIVKQLDLCGDLRGIAYTNNSLLVVFGYPDSCVKVMNLWGKMLGKFKTDAAGNNYFKNPWYIALSEDQNTIFVSDRGNHHVISLRMDGTVQGVYTDDNLKDPCGLAVDRHDNVFVAGYMSHNIHQLSVECKPIGLPLDTRHGIEYPCMVTYCKTEHRLYIGYDSVSKRRHISVFQLQ